MRIKSFEVKGFAGFTQPVRVGPLDEVNVIYGANNAGKSNLLRALELYCHALGAAEAVTKAQAQILDAPGAALAAALQGALNWEQPDPVLFTVEWFVAKADLEGCGLHPEHACSRVTTTFQLTCANKTWELRTVRFLLENDDVSLKDKAKEPAIVVFGQQIRRLIADAKPFQFEQPVLPYAMIGRHAEGFPQVLRDALFDVSQSRHAAERRRWELFVELAGTVRAEVGDGNWQTIFDRRTGRADLLYVREGGALTLEQMGSGVQRLAGLVAELCLASERVICAEEPEWRLSPALQKRFVKIARRVMQAGIGPTQLFISTHSPVMAALGRAFALELDSGVPVLSEKPWQAPGVEAAADDKEDAELGGLIGLVETLAEIDPNKLAAGARPGVAQAVGAGR